MKKCAINRISGLMAIVAVMGLSVVLFSFTQIQRISDIWTKVGLTEEVGIGNIQSCFLEGYFYQLNPKAAKSIAVGDRAAITSDLLRFGKNYVNSTEFVKDYEWYKNEKVPKAPKDCRTFKEVQQEMIGRIKEAIAQNDDAMKDMDGDLKKTFQEGNNQMKMQLKEYENPENQTIKYMYEAEKMQHESAIKKYEEDLKEFEELYPKDIKSMVKDRIELFLKITEGIDYNAELKTLYGKKVFVNPRYEKMPEEWKMGYRCGKEVTETARAFAKEWMGELK